MNKAFLSELAGYFLLIIVLAFLSFNSTAQSTPATLTKQQALEDFHWLRFSLEYVHPRLYKYEDKKTVDARFDSLQNSIGKSISGLDFLALVSKTNAKLHCGHLYTIPQAGLSKEIQDKKNLPFHIKILENKLYIFNNCSDANIPDGSRILSINGKSDSEVLNRMLQGVPADGFIQTRKLRLLERYFNYTFQGFDLYYYLFADRNSTFKIVYQPYGSSIQQTELLKGISIEERKNILLTKYKLDELQWFKTPSPQFVVNPRNNSALLTVSRSFYDKSIDPNFDSLLASSFRTIKEKKISHLILDLRNNEGGDESQQIALMTYLYNKPFRLYQNIYLSHLDFRPLSPVIIERDTADLLFNNDDAYMRKDKDLWINNYEYSDNLKLREPNPDVFTGKLYVLMNGSCFSSAADLISDLKRSTNPVFIGEESGGAFDGPTGGSEIVIQLPNSKIMVRISPNIQVGYMPQQHPIGRGVIPTHPVKYTVDALVQHRDLEMELAEKLILATPKAHYTPAIR